MDEEKAAAYYDEMLRKGGGAAKLKQGLGYGSSSPLASSQGTFLNFVRGDSHEENATKFEKENRLAAVRDKLKRRSVKNDGADDSGRHQRRHSSRSLIHDRGHGNSAEGRPQSRSRDREPLSRSDRSCRRERSSRSSSSDDPNRRHTRPSPVTSDSTSSSGSHSRHKRSRRNDRREQERLPRSKRRSKSPRRASRRSSSGSPADRNRHACRDSGRVSCSRKSPSVHAEKPYRKIESRSDTRDHRKLNALDFAKLIPGFDDMTPAEKVREKMKLQLSDTVSKDKAKGIDSDWERFVFNKSAPLDDDAKLDYFGDGTGAGDDTGFLQNTGSTLLSTNSIQAKREAQIQAAHDAAIFGPPTGMSSEKMASQSNVSQLEETAPALQGKEASSIDSLLSDQVLAAQQGSWRERALKLKQQRAANALS